MTSSAKFEPLARKLTPTYARQALFAAGYQQQVRKISNADLMHQSSTMVGVRCAVLREICRCAIVRFFAGIMWRKCEKPGCTSLCGPTMSRAWSMEKIWKLHINMFKKSIKIWKLTKWQKIKGVFRPWSPHSHCEEDCLLIHNPRLLKFY